MKKNIIMLTITIVLYSHAYTGLEDIAPGIVYEHFLKQDPKQSIHILTIDPKAVAIKPVHAMGTGTDRETVSSMALRTNAIAAINAGFFRRGGRYNGNSLNILKIDDALYADPGFVRGVLGWNSDNTAYIDYLAISWQALCNNSHIPITRINQPLHDDEIILYTSAFRDSTLTCSPTYEIVVHNNQIRAISTHGNCSIPKNGYVISFGKNIKSLASASLPGMPCIITSTFTAPNTLSVLWQNIKFIVGSTGTLVYNDRCQSADDIDKELQQGIEIFVGNDETTANFHNAIERDWLINKRHPRTALGITQDNDWILVVVDGRQPELSEGMTLPELALYMHSLGCKYAINLGGGGDTTMVVHDQIVNSPSGASMAGTGFMEKKERPISDALCIYSKH